MQVLEQLENWFGNCPGALIAFSGGVDSSLVAYLARTWLGREHMRAVISASASLKLSELELAKDFARMHDIPLEIIITREIENPNYFNNPSNRCYYCKHTLYDELAAMQKDHPNWWVLNGTNTDDSGDYRPGLKAANEFQVRSPLMENGLDKTAVRDVAAHYNLDCWDKPASPCLASRVPYGEEVTVEKLRQIEAAEAIVAQMGFSNCRVRHYREKACVEVPAPDVARLLALHAELEIRLLSIGFTQVDIDTEGLVSGKLNRALPALLTNPDVTLINSKSQN